MKFSQKNICCVVKDMDLGISRCMEFKSRALFCPMSRRPTYPCTRVHTTDKSQRRGTLNENDESTRDLREEKSLII